MESIIFSFNIVVPIFLVGAVGYLMRQKNVISENFVKEATALCFDVLLPCMLFRSVYTANFSKAADKLFFWYCFLGNIAVIVLSFLIVPLVIKEKRRTGSIIQAVFRSNIMLLGFSVLLNTYGEKGTDYVAILIAPVISLYNVAAVAAFAFFNDECGEKLTLKSIFLKIIKNHYIIALIAAVSLVFLNIELPEFINKTIDFVADIATPLALLMLGGQFSFKSAKKNLRYSLSACFVRLIAVPFVFVTGGILLGYRGPALMTILVLFGSASAVSCAAMAMRSGGDYELSGEITLLSTFFSVFTLFGFIAVLKHLSYL